VVLFQNTQRPGRVNGHQVMLGLWVKNRFSLCCIQSLCFWFTVSSNRSFQLMQVPMAGLYPLPGFDSKICGIFSVGCVGTVSSGKLKLFKCDVCEKRYVGPCGLARHYKLHPTHGSAAELLARGQPLSLALIRQHIFE